MGRTYLYPVNRTWKRIEWSCIVLHGLRVLLLGALLSGCPDTDIGDTPPFDTTGSYSGTYSTGDGKQFRGAPDCTISLELAQFVEQPLIAYTFAGIARLNWDCMLPPAARDVLGITSDVLTTPVLATLAQNGSFSLNVSLDGSNIPQALFDALDASDIDTNIPVQSFSLVFTGMGDDADSDGMMDSCMGTLQLMVVYEDNGTQMVDLGGSFEATRSSTS